MSEILARIYSVMDISLAQSLYVFLGVLLLWLYYALRMERGKLLIDMIPGYKDWPIVGDIFHLKRDPVGR